MLLRAGPVAAEGAKSAAKGGPTMGPEAFLASWKAVTTNSIPQKDADTCPVQSYES
jgi:hypothetical protein